MKAREAFDAAFTVAHEEPKPLVAVQDGEVDLTAMTDDAIVAMALHYEERLASIQSDYQVVIRACKAMIEKRLRERGDSELATSLLDKCALVPEWSEYTEDVDAAAAAAEELRSRGHDEDAAKIYKVRPAYIEPAREVPEKRTIGPQVSVEALVRRFGGDPRLGPLLRAIRTRASLGTRFVWKQKKSAS